MTEPVTTTTIATVATPVGFLALLIGAIGPIGADVMLVIISALVGCIIRLSEMKLSVWRSVGFIFIGVATSLVSSWAVSSLISEYLHILHGPYTPSITAMLIGFHSNRMPKIFDFLTEIISKFITKKMGANTSDSDKIG